MCTIIILIDFDPQKTGFYADLIKLQFKTFATRGEPKFQINTGYWPLIIARPSIHLRKLFDKVNQSNRTKASLKQSE